MAEKSNQKSIKSMWIEYYILDSINQPTNISTYPINDNKDLLLDLIETMLVANLIIYNLSDKKYQLTSLGKKRLSSLYKLLNLNKYNRHLYPNIYDLI